MPKPKEAENVTAIRPDAGPRPLAEVLVTPISNIQAAAEIMVTRIAGGAYACDPRTRDRTVEAIEDVLVQIRHAFELAAVNETRAARRRAKRPRPKFHFFD